MKDEKVHQHIYRMYIEIQDTNITSNLGVEKFHTLHALSVYICIYEININNHEKSQDLILFQDSILLIIQ
jgi:hypothetical protein